jgi:soluble lytic murein transglycosylase-like protein
MSLASLLFVGLSIVAPSASPQARCPQWENMIRKAGLPVSEFSLIMWRESRCDPQAVGVNQHARNDIGLLQINASWSTLTKQTCRTTKSSDDALLFPPCNLAVAKSLYKTSGFTPWKSTFKKGDTK